MRQSLILVFLLPLLAGCATERYTEFPALSAWPTAWSAIEVTKDATPAYEGWPQRPYRVVGSIQLAGSRHAWKSSEIARVASMARSRGGDAVVLRGGKPWDAIGHAAAIRRVILPPQTAVLVIKWKPEAEVEETVHRLDGFRAYLRRSYPALHLESKGYLWKLAMEYITWIGLEIDSQRGTAELEKTLTSLMTPATGSGPSKWLFRGVIREHGSPAEATVCGIATVTRAGESLAIGFDEGDTQVSFAGVTKDLALDGDFALSMGRSHIKAHAQGTFEQDRITLNAQAQDSNGQVSATFIFLR